MNVQKICLNSINFGKIDDEAKQRAIKKGLPQEEINRLCNEQEDVQYDITVAPSHTDYDYAIYMPKQQKEQLGRPLFLFETLKAACLCAKSDDPYAWMQQYENIPESEL